MANDWDDYDWCYECTGLGDDYYFDDDGELVCACADCVHSRITADIAQKMGIEQKEG